MRISRIVKTALGAIGGVLYAAVIGLVVRGLVHDTLFYFSPAEAANYIFRQVLGNPKLLPLYAAVCSLPAAAAAALVLHGFALLPRKKRGSAVSAAVRLGLIALSLAAVLIIPPQTYALSLYPLWNTFPWLRAAGLTATGAGLLAAALMAASAVWDLAAALRRPASGPEPGGGRSGP